MEIIDEFVESSAIRFKPIKTRAMLAIIGISVVALLLVVILFLRWKLTSLFIGSLNNDYYSQQHIVTFAIYHDFLNYAYIAFYWLSLVPFFIWLYRAHNNLFANKVRGMQFNSGQAVGYCFIPIVNVYYLPASFNEVYKGTLHLFENKSITLPFTGSTWYLPVTWLLSHIASGITFRFGFSRLINSVITPDTVQQAFKIDCIAMGLSLGAFALMLMLILKITSMQQKIINRQAD